MNYNPWILSLATLAIGAAGGYYLADQSSNGTGQAMSDKAPQPRGKGPCPGGAEPLMWRNPMNPKITSPTFTKDSMGMDYLPICAEDQGSDKAAGTVRIDPTVVQDIGVRTARAEQGSIARDIRTVGRVTFDEERVARLHPKIEGWVERLFVDKTGEEVKKNTMLLALYSPQLVSSAEEYLLALKNWRRLEKSPFPDVRDGARRLLDTSLERLKLLDVPDHQLREIREKGRVPKALHIHSPFDGTVMKIGAREGSRITSATEIYMIADLSRVWVLVDVYENELPWVKAGDTAEMRLPAVPGRVFTGKVSYIYPYLEGKTRTNKVRIEFANSERLLKPEMYANVRIKADARGNAVIVPAEAIVRSGKHNLVFVQRAPGKFEPRQVRLGVASDGRVQILAGLAPGERVVTSAQFLIDSESKLNEATAKMMEPKEAAPSATDMDMQGMQMDAPAGMDMQGMSMDDAGMGKGVKPDMQGGGHAH
jgi:Cu(I)/Ag(I) efflux system membrane fusion protein